MTRLKLLITFLALSFIANAAVQRHHLSVQFDSDKHELTPQATQQLLDLIVILKEDSDFSIRLDGHTDDVGNSHYNHDLAERRSLAVKQFLLENGVPDQQIETYSYGEHNPLKPNLNETYRDINRRVEVQLIIYDFESIGELEQTMQEGSVSEFVIDPKKENVIKGNKGVAMIIQANSFVDVEGNPINEPVEVTLTEALDFEDFVSHGLATQSGDGLLVSGGMFKVTAQTASGTEVELNPEMPITTAVTAERTEEDMQIFRSDDGGDWSLTANEIVTTYRMGMPAYPRLNSNIIELPEYCRDYSTKPEEPDTYGRPRAPKVPDQQDYKAEVSWYNFFMRGYLERQAHKNYMEAMGRYEKKEEIYKRRLDLYVKHNALKEKRFQQYKKDLKMWNEQSVLDSITFYQTEEYVALKEKRLELMQAARIQWEIKVKEWNVLKREKMGEMADKMDAMGVASEDAVNTYISSVSELSWINIDRFLKLPLSDTRAITLKDVDKSDEKVYIVFKNIKSMLPMSRAEFGKQYARSLLPKTEEMALLAYKVVDGKAMVYYEEVNPKESTYKMEFEHYSFRDLKDLLEGVQG